MVSTFECMANLRLIELIVFVNQLLMYLYSEVGLKKFLMSLYNSIIFIACIIIIV